jgi:tryptophan synthase alpha chain
MNRIKTCFDKLRAEKRAALIPFITAGDPHPTLTVPMMHTLVEAGADIIELGIPFSDPMADGPVIQRASERALAAGTTLRDVLDIVKEFRKKDQSTPVVFMGYLNPIELMGYENFVKAAQTAELDGLLTVDLPPEEMKEMGALLRSSGIAPIFLLAPTTPDARIKQICTQAEGYVYSVSIKGVTGSAKPDKSAVANKVNAIREHTDLPIGVGFGIKDAETAAQIAQVSDAVIVGSALVRLVETVAQEELLERIGEFLSGLREAMDN